MGRSLAGRRIVSRNPQYGTGVRAVSSDSPGDQRFGIGEERSKKSGENGLEEPSTARNKVALEPEMGLGADIVS